MLTARLWPVAMAAAFAGGCVGTSAPIAPVEKGESQVGMAVSAAPPSLMVVSYRRGLSPTVDAGVQAGLFGVGADVRRHFSIDDGSAWTWTTGAVLGFEASRIETRLHYARFSDVQLRVGPYLSYWKTGTDFFYNSHQPQSAVSAGLNLGVGGAPSLPFIGSLPVSEVIDLWVGYAVPTAHRFNTYPIWDGLELAFQLSFFLDRD